VEREGGVQEGVRDRVNLLIVCTIIVDVMTMVCGIAHLRAPTLFTKSKSTLKLSLSS